MQPLMHSAVFTFRRRSRISWGALTSKARNWLIACVFALTALRLVTETARIASAAPDCSFGIAVALPERTARAAFSASVGSDFPLDRRIARSGRLTSEPPPIFLDTNLG